MTGVGAPSLDDADAVDVRRIRSNQPDGPQTDSREDDTWRTSRGLLLSGKSDVESSCIESSRVDAIECEPTESPRRRDEDGEVPGMGMLNVSDMASDSEAGSVCNECQSP